MTTQKCGYCGKVNESSTFIIGATKGGPAWVMHYGTGKLACPDCHEKGKADGRAAVDKHVKANSVANLC